MDRKRLKQHIRRVRLSVHFKVVALVICRDQKVALEGDDNMSVISTISNSLDSAAVGGLWGVSLAKTSIIGAPKADVNNKVGSAKSFSQVLESKNESNKDVELKDLFGLKGFEDLKRATESVAAGGKLSNSELLFFQIRANEMHFKVEMAAKVGEAMMSSMKKLQQGQ